MKTNLPKFENHLRSAVLLVLMGTTPAWAEMGRFSCLKEMLPISDRASFQLRRKGYEAPFSIADKYIVLPEVSGVRVTGFFVYDSEHAWYYDSIERAAHASSVSELIATLRPESSGGVLELTAQPNGLETITISYLPTYNPRATGDNGPVMLGSSVLPVVGAFVSRPQQVKINYFNPAQSTRGELQAWMDDHAPPARTPAGAMPLGRAEELPHTIVKMTTKFPKIKSAIWQPLYKEMSLRREWVRNHNLDEQTFKQIAKVIEECPDSSAAAP